MVDESVANDGLPLGDQLKRGEAKNILDKREIERLLDLTESAEEFTSAIDFLSQPQEVLGISPPQPATLEDMKRVTTQLRTKLGELTGGLTSEQSSHYAILNEVRTTAQAEGDKKFAEFFQEKLGINWFQSAEDRYAWKKDHAIPSSHDSPDLKEFHARPIISEEILERSKIDDNRQAINFARNNMSKPLYDQPMGLAGSMEGLGIEPITEQTRDDLDRVGAVLMYQENILIDKMRIAPNSKLLMDLDSAKWTFRRDTDNTFYEAFEKEMGVPYFEPRVEEKTELEEKEVPLTAEVFNRALGTDVKNLAQAAIEAQWQASTPRSSYYLDAPRGMSAALNINDDPDRPRGDELVIKMSSDTVKRVIRVSVEAEKSRSLPLNLTELDAAPDLPEVTVIRQIHEHRGMNLTNGIEVSKSILYEQMYYRAEKGSPDFRPSTNETITIFTPLSTVPQVDGESIMMYSAWDGYPEDAFEVEPNGILYKKYGDDNIWTKTYVYRDQNSVINTPEYDTYVSKSGKSFDLENISVSGGEERQTIDSIMAQAALGEIDQSLVELVATEVSRATS
jgi:hypothetical protein